MKVNMLYDYTYSDSFKGDIKEISIDINNITMDDIKIKFEGDNYDDTLTELLEGKFKKINFIKKLNTLVLKKYTEGFSLLVLISPYNNSDEIDRLDSLNNNDSLFSYFLSPLILSKKTRHISLPVINIDVKFTQMIDILKPYTDIFDLYQELIEKERINEMFSLRVRESFFKSIILDEFINMEECDIKKLLFQVLHTLAVLHNQIPQLYTEVVHYRYSIQPWIIFRLHG